MTTPRFCRYCGGELIPGNAFCSHCGKAIPTPATPNAAPQQQYAAPAPVAKKASVPPLAIVGVVAVIAAALFFLVLNKSDDKPSTQSAAGGIPGAPQNQTTGSGNTPAPQATSAPAQPTPKVSEIKTRFATAKKCGLSSTGNPNAVSGTSTMIVGAKITVLAPPSPWVVRQVPLSRNVGAGPGVVFAATQSDLDAIVPRDRRISIYTVDAAAAREPEEFLVASVPADALTQSPCKSDGDATSYPSVQIETSELRQNQSVGLDVQYMVIYDQQRSGRAALVIFEQPTTSSSGISLTIFAQVLASLKLIS